jgi:arylsulfatase A-like enzyme
MKSRVLSLLTAVLLSAGCTEGAEPQLPAAPRLSAGSPKPQGPVFRTACALPTELLRRLRRGYYPRRSPEIVMVPEAPNFFGSFTTTTHSGPWSYLQEVPLVLYGPGFIKAQGQLQLEREITLADLAPTVARLVDTRLPEPRPGEPVTEALLERPKRRPKLIVVVVWDGGGWNVLRRWPNAWPQLERLMASGTSVQDVLVGSSPSVTPAIHATIGTGAFPKQHGIVDIPLRAGAEVVGSWDEQSPTYLATPSLADVYDLATDNRALIAMVAEKGWHLGMIGHGAELSGADHDVAVMGEAPGHLYTNPRYYDLPEYLQDVAGYDQDVRAVDAADGEVDGLWRGHDMLGDPEQLRLTPTFSLYQNRLIEKLMRREGYGRDSVTDLLFTNYKQIDLVGHAWNMTAPEEQDAIRFSDQALGELVAALDSQVGRRQWVLAVTADHGQTPLTDNGRAWPIEINEVIRDVADHFEVSQRLVQDIRPGALWTDGFYMKERGIDLVEISKMLLSYQARDNIIENEPTPEPFRAYMREKVFEAVFPYSWMPQLWNCAKQRAKA